jgi:hypothetical protein
MENLEKGNISLHIDQIKFLASELIKKLAPLLKVSEDTLSKKLNSNFQSTVYQQIIKKIKETHELTILEKYPKTVSIIFYYSKKVISRQYDTFRRHFIKELILFLGKNNIEDFFKSSPRTFTNVFDNFGKTNPLDTFNKISGYWEIYYVKEGNFLVSLQNNGFAELSKIKICIDNNKAKYFHPNDSGSGSIEIYGANFVLNLISGKSGKTGIIYLNTGQKNISDYDEHVKFTGGIFMHTNKSGYIKTGRCAMIYCSDINEDSFLDPTDVITRIELTSTGLSEKLRNFFSQMYNTMLMSSDTAIGPNNLSASAADFLAV